MKKIPSFKQLYAAKVLVPFLPRPSLPILRKSSIICEPKKREGKNTTLVVINFNHHKRFKWLSRLCNRDDAM